MYVQVLKCPSVYVCIGSGLLKCPMSLELWIVFILLGKLDVMKGLGFQGIFAVCTTVA